MRGSSGASDGRCHKEFTAIFHLAKSNSRLAPAVIAHVVSLMRPQQHDLVGPARLFVSAKNRIGGLRLPL